jgi:hypothetical protein
VSTIALDPLIAEAKRRARRRQLIALVMGVVSLGAVAAYVVARGGGRSSVFAPRVSIPAGATGAACGVRGVGARILSPEGRILYREPGKAPNGFPAIQCSGSAIWAVWNNGGEMSQEAYFGARSLDGGRTWHPAFAEPYFLRKAPNELGTRLGVWMLHGPRTAYFVSACTGCGGVKNALFVTKNGGRTFVRYDVPALTSYTVTGIRVNGDELILRAKRVTRGIEPARRTATVRVA